MADVITKWSDFILTDKGLALRQIAIARGMRIEFIYAEIGEGVPTNPSDIPLMTALVSPTERVGVKRSLSAAATHYLDVRIDNRDFEAASLMRELAVFARLEKPGQEEIADPELEGFYEPIVYGYSYTLRGYEPIPAGKEFHRIWTIGINTEISRSKEIVIFYDGNKTYVLSEELDEILNRVNQTINKVELILCDVEDVDNIASRVWVEERLTESIDEHNLDENSHPDIRLMIPEHNVSEDCHADIRALLSEKANINNPALIGAAMLNGYPIAAAETPKIYDLSLASGFSPTSGGFKYYKDSLGFVHINAAFTKSSKLVANETIATLPVGFRPSFSTHVVIFSTYSYTGSNYIVYSTAATIQADGLIRVSGSVIPPDPPVNYALGIDTSFFAP